MKKFVLSILVLTLVLSVGCSYRMEDRSSGHSTQKTYNFDSFTELDIGSAFEVIVTEGEYGVVVEVDENYIDNLLVRERGGILEVGLKPGFNFNVFNSEMKAYISMPRLDGVEASGASRVLVDSDMVYGNRVYVDLSGAASMDADIVTKSVDFDLSGASQFKGLVEVDDLRANISGASSTDIDGKSKSASVEASGASRFHSRNFVTDSLNADASGASNISMQVDEEASVEASGASTINLSGSPTITSQNVDMASNVQVN